MFTSTPPASKYAILMPVIRVKLETPDDPKRNAYVNCLVDTGASASGIAAQYVRSLNLQKFGSPVKALGAGGTFDFLQYEVFMNFESNSDKGFRGVVVSLPLDAEENFRWCSAGICYIYFPFR